MAPFSALVILLTAALTHAAPAALPQAFGSISVTRSHFELPTLGPIPTRTVIEPCTMSVCVDYVNECGQLYGDCFLAPECGGTWPTFTAPPCPTSTGGNNTTTTTTDSYTISEWTISDSATFTTSIPQETESSTQSDSGTTTCITWGVPEETSTSVDNIQVTRTVVWY